MLTIWGRRNSSNVKKALWAAEELGLPYESIEVGGPFGGLDTPDFLALNPNGVIPVIDDDGMVIWESNTVVRYLAARYGDETSIEPGRQVLWLDDPATRSVGDRWMDWTLSLIVPFRDAFMNLVRLPEGQRDMAAAERGFARSAELFAIADRALAEAPYLSGERFAMGDIPLGCLTWGWYVMPKQHPDLPHLRAWYERLLERPAYAKVVAEG